MTTRKLKKRGWQTKSLYQTLPNLLEFFLVQALRKVPANYLQATE
jgi:hypothetical protein